ncbi:MAG TPA: hypothetical protein VF993_09405 [Myxococcales bacterium]|jgi:hypothetical protein
MRTSNILTIGGAFVAVLGGLFSAVMLKGMRGFQDFSGLVVGLVFLAIGVATFVVGRKRARVEAESDERSFLEMAIALARKNGGQVSIDPVCKASGLSKDEATARMRQLTGRGVFDLDFDGSGQMVWKLSPDAGRSQLAEIAGRQ